LPETVFGPTCAVAYLGSFNEGDWRAAHVPLDVLKQDDPGARGVFIANLDGSEVVPAEAISASGSAFNVPGRQVLVSLEVNNKIVAEETAAVDSFGYWEVELLLPEGTAPGSGRLVALARYGNDAIADSVPFEIVSR
jgi:hypothetical protein